MTQNFDLNFDLLRSEQKKNSDLKTITRPEKNESKFDHQLVIHPIKASFSQSYDDSF